MSKSKAKGAELEHFVLQIEDMLLKQDPDLVGLDARIERNRWFNVDGVSIEADVLVTIGAAEEKYHHLIECKNWSKPVGPEVISHLNTKQLLLHPRHTTLVAREVTRSARQLAEKFGIAIAYCSESFVRLQVEAPFFTHQPQSGTVSLQFYRRADEPVPALSENEACLFRGRLTAVRSVLDEAIGLAIEEAEQFDARRFLPGMHCGKAQFLKNYAPGEFVIKEVSVALMYSVFDYSSEVVFPPVMKRLGVKNRGGVIRVEYPEGTMGVKSLALEIVTRATAQR